MSGPEQSPVSNLESIQSSNLDAIENQAQKHPEAGELFDNKQLESLNNKNFLLLQQSQDIINTLLDKQDLFKNITYFFEYFTQPQS